MKSICIVLASLAIISPLVVNAKSTAIAPSLERYQTLLRKNVLLESCAENLRDDLRPIADDFGGWILDVVNRMERIIELRRTCDAIEMSDPPTRWELIQREACEVRFQGAIIVEVTRLGYDINLMLLKYPPIVRDSIRNYLQCAREQIPEFHEFNQMIASMHRQ